MASSPQRQEVTLTIGVLALQGAFSEHISLLHQAASFLTPSTTLNAIPIRTPAQLATADALIIPGGESTSISILASSLGLLEPLREFVKVRRKLVWGTCAGMILLAETVDGGDGGNAGAGRGLELVGGLDVVVMRNFFGRQVDSFEADVGVGFLGERDLEQEPFHAVFIRAPVVKELLPPSLSSSDGQSKAEVEILARLPGQAKAMRDGDGEEAPTARELGVEGEIVVVRQGNVFASAFHPELTGDLRMHVWWLREVVRAVIGG